jgi:hypothetical protein
VADHYTALIDRIEQTFNAGGTDFERMLSELAIENADQVLGDQFGRWKQLRRRIRQAQEDADIERAEADDGWQDHAPTMDAMDSTDHAAPRYDIPSSADDAYDPWQSEIDSESASFEQPTAAWEPNGHEEAVGSHDNWVDESVPAPSISDPAPKLPPRTVRHDMPTWDDALANAERELSQPDPDFNAILRAIKIDAPQNVLNTDEYERYNRVIVETERRRLELFNARMEQSDQEYYADDVSLADKIAALDRALNPRYVIDERAHDIRARRNELSKTEWSGDKLTSYLRYLETMLLDRSRVRESDAVFESWLREQEATLDAVRSTPLAPAQYPHAEHLYQQVKHERVEMGLRFDRTTSRSADFDYVGLMIEHEALKEQGVKVVKDALNPDNPVYIEINEFLAKLPQEYAQAMLRLAKTNLANIFGIDAMTVDQFIKDYESEPHG